MYDGMNLYRAVVSYASATTGDIRVRIPAILGPTEVLPISKIGRAAVNGTWEVPLLGSQVVVAIEDDRFSNVYMVYPNLAVIQAAEGGGGGGEEPPPEEEQSVPSGAIMQFGGSAAPTGWLLCQGGTVSKTLYSALYTAIGDVYAIGGEPVGQFRLPNLKGKVPVGLDVTQTEFNAIGFTDGGKSIALALTNLPQHSHSLNSHTHSANHGHSGSTTSYTHDHGDISSSGSHGHTVSRNFWGDNLTGGGTVSGNVGNWSSVSISGGSHTHSISNDSHDHTVSIPTTSVTTGQASGDTGNAGSASPTAFNILQPYIVLNYIIKV
jgi:microcystin-dependent protein